jgi:hypothetical protein
MEYILPGVHCVLPAERAEREGGHYGILAELRLVIRVEPHAVAPVPIPVHEHVVEGHASTLAHSPEEALTAGVTARGSRVWPE